jgi:hypothetical protein
VQNTPKKVRRYFQRADNMACALGAAAAGVGKRRPRVLSHRDPIADGVDLSMLEHVSPIEWDNVVLYGQTTSWIGNSSDDAAGP